MFEERYSPCVTRSDQSCSAADEPIFPRPPAASDSLVQTRCSRIRCSVSAARMHNGGTNGECDTSRSRGRKDVTREGGSGMEGASLVQPMSSRGQLSHLPAVNM